MESLGSLRVISELVSCAHKLEKEVYISYLFVINFSFFINFNKQESTRSMHAGPCQDSGPCQDGQGPES